MKTKKEKQSKLTPKQRKIIDIVATCVQVAVIIIAITISAIVIANPISTSNKVADGNNKLLPVLTDSMNGTADYYEKSGFDAKTGFKAGDLVIAKSPENQRTLKVGDIVTYTGMVLGNESLITHRIVEVIDNDNDGLADTYVTHGDANPITATEHVNPLNILAVYKSHLKGVGSAINWLQNPTNFLLVIVLPLALLFIYNIILFVKMIMEAKLAKAKETAGNSENVAIDEEEIKRKAIEEYLSKQAQAKQDTENSEKTEDTDNTNIE